MKALDNCGAGIGFDPSIVSLVDALPFYAMLIDAKHHIHLANKAVTSRLGVTPQDILGKHCPKAVHGLDGPYPGCPLEQSVEQGGIALETEFQDEKTGMWFASAIYPTDLRGSNGETLFLHTTRDIGEKKEAERLLKEINEELAEKVDLRTRELQDIVADLEQFVHSVSHDLKSPIHVMRGFSKILLDSCGSELEKSDADALKSIHQAASNMNDMVNGLLSLCRIDSHEMQLGNTSISEIARDMSRSLKENDPERQVQFVIGDEMEAVCDQRLLKQLMQNLLENAWKFTAETDSPLIEVGMTSRDKSGVFFVRDNGTGFPKSCEDMIFEPFKSAHSREQFEGTGTGLATSRRIIARHGGKIWAESGEKEGASFFFTLDTRNAGDGTREAGS